MADEMTLKKSTYQKILAGFFVLAVAFSFTAGFLLGGGATTGESVRTVQAPSPSPSPAPQAPPAAPSRVSFSLGDSPVTGEDSAPVTIVEFSDFQCPFCQRSFAESVPQIKSEYVETGKAKFVYMHFPLNFHPEAAPAALASECAKEQGKFWEYHDRLFENQHALSEASYKAWAAELGMNAEQFNDCYDSQKYTSNVQDDYQAGITAGVSGTPSFFIGTPETGYQKIVGAQPYSVIKSIIDQELS